MTKSILHHHFVSAQFPRRLEAGTESRAVACVPLMADDVSSCAGGEVCRGVGSAVIDDDHAIDVLLAALNHFGNGALLVVGGHGGNG